MWKVLVGTVCALVIAELLVRALGTTDADGQFALFGIPLPPMVIPRATIAERVKSYLASDQSFLIYDPNTGWAPRPGATGHDGLFHANAAGLRADVETPLEPRRGVLRIELFGDSFTFGDEVPLDETWGVKLEHELRARGFQVEVLNFGVNAYGIDQAYLRWLHLGRAYHPTVVILGLQTENALRDLNVFRPLYFAGTEIPLSKPRFILQGDGLDLVNSPALPPEQVPEVLGELAAHPDRARQHPLGAHERLLDGRDADHPWLRSKLVALVAGIAQRARASDPTAVLGRDPETIEVARRVVARFAGEVTADGAGFIAVYLPRKLELDAIAAGHATWDEPLLDAISQATSLVRPEDALMPFRTTSFQPAGHYGGALSAAVAHALVDPVSDALCERAPKNTRPHACRR